MFLSCLLFFFGIVDIVFVVVFSLIVVMVDVCWSLVVRIGMLFFLVKVLRLLRILIIYMFFMVSFVFLGLIVY